MVADGIVQPIIEVERVQIIPFRRRDGHSRGPAARQAVSLQFLTLQSSPEFRLRRRPLDNQGTVKFEFVSRSSENVEGRQFLQARKAIFFDYPRSRGRRV